MGEECGLEAWSPALEAIQQDYPCCEASRCWRSAGVLSKVGPWVACRMLTGPGTYTQTSCTVGLRSMLGNCSQSLKWPHIFSRIQVGQWFSMEKSDDFHRGCIPDAPGETGIHLEWKPGTPLCSRVATYLAAAAAAAQYWNCHAKLLQLCLTLCGPMDCSSPGSSVYGISQARRLEWAAVPS